MLGNKAINNQGNAIPIPKAVKTANNCQALAPKANATAVPKKGAEQGVANKVANIPCR